MSNSRKKNTYIDFFVIYKVKDSSTCENDTGVTG